jgi:hypothetical protein
MSKFEGFADEVRANNNPHRKRGCGVGGLLQDLPGEDAEQVEKVLGDPKYTHAAIHSALRRRVPDCPTVYTIGRHRRKLCGCFTEGMVELK